MNRIVKYIFDPGAYQKNINLVLLVLRLAVGCFMLFHGLDKFQMFFSSEPIQFDDPLGVGETTSLALAVFAEMFCSILLIIGLGTRLAATPLLFTMMVAAFVIHINDGFAKKELALLYAVIYITILSLGAGKYSVDYLITKKQEALTKL